MLTRPDKLDTRVDSTPAGIALFGKISVSARVNEQLFVSKVVTAAFASFFCSQNKVCVLKT